MENTIEKLIGADREFVICRLGKPENNSNNEIVYLMQTSFFGLYKKRLYLFFDNEYLRDYYIGA